MSELRFKFGLHIRILTSIEEKSAQSQRQWDSMRQTFNAAKLGISISFYSNSEVFFILPPSTGRHSSDLSQ